jgi:hypothetical protein
MKHHFYSINLLTSAVELNPELPSLLLANHSSWWDGFLVYLLNKRVYKKQFYLMMLEEQLQKNRFFSNLGAFSINPGHPRNIRATLDYCVDVLEQPDSLLVIFPQGELLPWGIRPLGFKAGITKVLQQHVNPVNLILLAIKIEYLKAQRPQVFMQGQSLPCEDPNQCEVDSLQQSMEKLLETMSASIVSGESGNVILKGNESINVRFERLRGLHN